MPFDANVCEGFQFPHSRTRRLCTFLSRAFGTKRRDGGTVKGLGRGEYHVSPDGTVEEAIDTLPIE
jgi:hypothetical protein